MILFRLARYHLFLVALPALVAACVAVALMAMTGAGARVCWAVGLYVLVMAFGFGMAVTVPAVLACRFLGIPATPAAFVRGGVVLGSVFAYAQAIVWSAWAGAEGLSAVFMATAWFSVLVFGVPVGAFSGLAAHGMLARD